MANCSCSPRDTRWHPVPIITGRATNMYPRPKNSRWLLLPYHSLAVPAGTCRSQRVARHMPAPGAATGHAAPLPPTVVVTPGFGTSPPRWHRRMSKRYSPEGRIMESSVYTSTTAWERVRDTHVTPFP